VEIITSPKQTPKSRDWLAFVKTSRARQKVRQWIRQEEHEQSVKLGKEFLDRELKKLRVSLPPTGPWSEVAEELGFPDWEHVYAGLAQGDGGPRR
jgi:GTP diphosphokinase / guanosine-3',5'-bis(diphosphate) 3'-diphosphatase